MGNDNIYVLMLIQLLLSGGSIQLANKCAIVAAPPLGLYIRVRLSRAFDSLASKPQRPPRHFAPKVQIPDDKGFKSQKAILNGFGLVVLSNDSLTGSWISNTGLSERVPKHPGSNTTSHRCRI